MKFEEITADITADEIREQAWRKGRVLSVIIGAPVYAVLRLFRKNAKEYRGVPFFEIGHLIQNAKVGGFKMLALTVGSVFRYHARRLFRIKTPYEGWWFEEQATKLGEEWKGDEV